MTYKLIVLTHGVNAAVLTRTVAAFLEHVTPAPVDCLLASDGPADLAVGVALGLTPWPWTVGDCVAPRGFCTATREAWKIAADGDHEYVFWLEHDFLVTRPVDLRQLAAVLDQNPFLAQMALMRDAVNAEEVAAGGLYELRRGQYAPQRTFVPHAEGTAQRVADAFEVPVTHLGELTMADWLEHRAYLTTNPSLMRREWMAAHPWPEHPAECEGRFGIDLVLEGHTFGAWGTGSPWCEHVGGRTGFGY